MMRRTFAVLPVKAYDDAKSRLASVLAPPDRRRLADAMARDVLRALAVTPGVERVVVVTDEPVLQLVAAHLGAIVVPHAGTHDAAAASGVHRAVAGGAQRVLVVAADCPSVEPAELVGLLSSDEAIVVVPDRHGTGTNALLLEPPIALSLQFGDHSRERYERIARASGRRWATRWVPTLAWDVDEPDDLLALPASPWLGPHTRAVILDLAIRHGGDRRAGLGGEVARRDAEDGPAAAA